MAFFARSFHLQYENNDSIVKNFVVLEDGVEGNIDFVKKLQDHTKEVTAQYKNFEQSNLLKYRKSFFLCSAYYYNNVFLNNSEYILNMIESDQRLSMDRRICHENRISSRFI